MASRCNAWNGASSSWRDAAAKRAARRCISRISRTHCVTRWCLVRRNEQEPNRNDDWNRAGTTTGTVQERRQEPFRNDDSRNMNVVSRRLSSRRVSTRLVQRLPPASMTKLARRLSTYVLNNLGLIRSHKELCRLINTKVASLCEEPVLVLIYYTQMPDQ
jgi:hypothetical protein